MMTDLENKGKWVIIFGIVFFVSAMVLSFMFAPVMSVDSNQERVTIIGSQGGGPGWHELGSVYLLEGAEQRWKEDSADSYFDVTVLEDGRILPVFKID